MALKASKTVQIPAAAAANKPDAIPIENFCPKTKKENIGLSRSSYSGDGEVKVLPSFLKFLKKVFRIGEWSRPEPEDDTKPVPCSTFMCGICADEKPNGESFRILGCHHSYCADCVIRYVGSKLEDNIVSIKCPVPACNGLLEPQHCRSILPEQVFDRWEYTLREAAILDTGNIYCPFKDCSALLFCEKFCESKGKSEVNAAASLCFYCRRYFCAKCRLPWHVGITCDEFKGLKEGERSREDLLLMNLAKSMKWMRCPRCSIYIQKVKGCYRVTCRCGCTFCYDCGFADLTFYHTCKRRRNSS